jgi:hypothetical protein
MIGCIILQGMQLTEPISTKVTLCSTGPAFLLEVVWDAAALSSALTTAAVLSGSACFGWLQPRMLPNTTSGAWHEHPPVARRYGIAMATAMAMATGIINFIVFFILMRLLNILFKNIYQTSWFYPMKQRLNLF